MSEYLYDTEFPRNRWRRVVITIPGPRGGKGQKLLDVKVRRRDDASAVGIAKQELLDRLKIEVS